MQTLRLMRYVVPANRFGWVMGLLLGASCGYGAPATDSVRGELTVASRQFWEPAAHPGQGRGQGSASLQGEYHRQAGDQQWLLAPLVRVDSLDKQRNRIDLTQAYWQYLATHWELKVGFERVFWGVVESYHLVDTINQVDLAASPDRTDKLGQPMIQLTLPGPWGLLDLYLLTGFREAVFPGREGRLRPGVEVDHGAARYESSAGRKRLDTAARYQQHWGPLDLGLAYFHGINRAPRLVLEERTGGLRLVPEYDTIHQASLDAQLTLGAWLWKLEALYRWDSRNLQGERDNFAAAIAGFEYTRFGFAGNAWDLGLLAELLWDERGAQSTLPYQRHLFLASRLALNDPGDTSLLLGTIRDWRHPGWAWRVEGSTRFSDRWTGELVAMGFSSHPRGALADLRRDDHIQLALSYWF